MTRFRLMGAATVLVATLSFYGCSESSDDCTPGSEGCVCSEGQCLSGLVCLSNTCVDDGGTGGTAGDGGSGGSGAFGGGGAGGAGATGGGGSGGIGGMVGGPAPIAYYPFNGNASDESGQGNHGTVNGATLTVDRFGNADSAYEFDGVSSFIDLGDVFNSVDLPFSISVWLHKTTASGWGAVLSSDDFPGSGPYVGFWMQTQGAKIALSYGDGGIPAQSSVRGTSGLEDISLGEWNHVVVTVRGPMDSTIYIDGVDVGNNYGGSGGPMVHNSFSARIGRLTFGPQYYEGDLDDLRIYDVSLSQSEVDALFHEGGWN